jgi:hypothetical protein
MADVLASPPRVLLPSAPSCEIVPQLGGWRSRLGGGGNSSMVDLERIFATRKGKCPRSPWRQHSFVWGGWHKGFNASEQQSRFLDVASGHRPGERISSREVESSDFSLSLFRGIFSPKPILALEKPCTGGVCSQSKS